MKEFFSLKILDKFKPVFSKMGVNYEMMRKILSLKLTLDERRTPAVISNNRKSKKDQSLLKKSILSYGFIGIMAMIFIIMPFPYMIKMSLCFGILIFMLMMSIISDFASVLLDVESRQILLTKPIDEQTFSAAKIMHIFIYMATITIVMSAPSLIAGTIKSGIGYLIIFVIQMVLLDELVIFLTTFLYGFILKKFDGEKLKDIINYFQIALTIVLIIGYQVLGRMFNLMDINLEFVPKLWHMIFPPMWFAAPYELFLNGNTNIYYITLTLIGVILPTIAFILNFKVVMPKLEKNLYKMTQASKGAENSLIKKSIISKRRSKVIIKDKIENTFYHFTKSMLKNERKLKLKIYPNLVFAIIFPIIMIASMTRNVSSIEELVNTIRGGHHYLYMYLTILMISGMGAMLTGSEKFKGAWIYGVLPIESPKQVYKGMSDAFLIKYAIPTFLVSMIPFLFIYKGKIVLDVIIGLFAMIVAFLINIRVVKLALPFSESVDKVQNGNYVVLLTMLFVNGAMAGIHFIVSGSIILKIAMIIALLILGIIFWNKLFPSKWEEVVDR